MPVQTPPISASYMTTDTPEATGGPGGSSTTELRLTAPRRFAPGSFSEAVGAVLSIRRGPTGAPMVTLPATSDATVRKKYRPSGRDVVSNGDSNGSELSEPIVDHAAPSGLTSKTTLATPEPVSLAVPFIVTTARRFAPG